MLESLYANARLYDLMFPQPSGPGSKAQFYLDLTATTGGPVLELGCGTGSVLLPIAERGIACQGIDLSRDMLAQARAKFESRGLTADLHVGDMSDFDLHEWFGLVFVASNSLTHLHATGDIVDCFRAVRRHLAPGGQFAFDVFNPSVRVLAGADGIRRERQRFADPERGEIRVDVEERYDAAAQVTRGIWYFSTVSEPDFAVSSVEVRSFFPQELGFLLQAGGLRLVERFGDFERAPFTSESQTQVCICEAAE
jgi:SAM-dependent methyltransferase